MPPRPDLPPPPPPDGPRPPCGRGRPSGRTYLRLPVNPDDGFPQAFRLSCGGRTYRVLLYVNLPETESDPPPETAYELPADDAFMVMRVTREGPGAAEVIFQRKLVLALEYEAAELAFIFCRLRVARGNLNGVGAFGSDVVGGVAPRWAS